jgi:hypothetical protein
MTIQESAADLNPITLQSVLYFAEWLLLPTCLTVLYLVPCCRAQLATGMTSTCVTPMLSAEPSAPRLKMSGCTISEGFRTLPKKSGDSKASYLGALLRHRKGLRMYLSNSRHERIDEP